MTTTCPGCWMSVIASTSSCLTASIPLALHVHDATWSLKTAGFRSSARRARFASIRPISAMAARAATAISRRSANISYSRAAYVSLFEGNGRKRYTGLTSAIRLCPAGAARFGDLAVLMEVWIYEVSREHPGIVPFVGADVTVLTGDAGRLTCAT
jgi:hypothetical protein